MAMRTDGSIRFAFVFVCLSCAHLSHAALASQRADENSPPMVVLVDFDNIEKIDRQRGLSILLPRILDAVGAPNLVDKGRVQFRLYGGWFEGRNLSRRAQVLAAEIGKDYPTVIGIGGS